MSIATKFAKYVKKIYNEEIDTNSYNVGKRNVLDKMSEYMKTNDIQIGGKNGSEIIKEYKKSTEKRVLKQVKQNDLDYNWYDNLNCSIEHMKEIYGDSVTGMHPKINNEWYFMYGTNNIIVHDWKNEDGLHISVYSKELTDSLHELFMENLDCTMLVAESSEDDSDDSNTAQSTTKKIPTTEVPEVTKVPKVQEVPKAQSSKEVPEVTKVQSSKEVPEVQSTEQSATKVPSPKARSKVLVPKVLPKQSLTKKSNKMTLKKTKTVQLSNEYISSSDDEIDFIGTLKMTSPLFPDSESE